MFWKYYNKLENTEEILERYIYIHTHTQTYIPNLDQEDIKKFKLI
jgi:hypothetical protein